MLPPIVLGVFGGLLTAPNAVGSRPRFCTYSNKLPWSALEPPRDVVVMSPIWLNWALFPTPWTFISAMPSADGNNSRRGPLLRTLTVDIPSTETSVWCGSAPCNEKLELLSDCTPGRNENKRYGLGLPAPRKLAGSESTSPELNVLALASVSVVTTAARPAPGPRPPTSAAPSATLP